MPFNSPFKDFIVPVASGKEQPNYGTNPARPFGEVAVTPGTVTPKELPENDLHIGTPDSGPGKY